MLTISIALASGIVDWKIIEPELIDKYLASLIKFHLIGMLCEIGESIKSSVLINLPSITENVFSSQEENSFAAPHMSAWKLPLFDEMRVQGVARKTAIFLSFAEFGSSLMASHSSSFYVSWASSFIDVISWGGRLMWISFTFNHCDSMAIVFRWAISFNSFDSSTMDDEWRAIF